MRVATAVRTTARGDEEPAMPFVITDPATDVTDSSATINGRVTDLGDAEAVDLRLEYREVDSDSWSATEDQQVTAETSCSETVENLAGETEYEYRVVASSDVGTETGETRSFVTDAVEIGKPAIESLRAGIQADRTRTSTLRWNGASPTPTAPSRKYGSSSETIRIGW